MAPAAEPLPAPWRHAQCLAPRLAPRRAPGSAPQHCEEPRGPRGQGLERLRVSQLLGGQKEELLNSGL